METESIMQAIGLTAAACTTLSFLPQAVKTWRTRSAKDLSLGMFSMFVIGVVLWLAYGLWLQDLPIILANLVTLILAGAILVFKIMHPKA